MLSPDPRQSLRETKSEMGHKSQRPTRRSATSGRSSCSTTRPPVRIRTRSVGCETAHRCGKFVPARGFKWDASQLYPGISRIKTSDRVQRASLAQMLPERDMYHDDYDKWLDEELPAPPAAPQPRTVTGSGSQRFAPAGTDSGPGGAANRESATGVLTPKNRRHVRTRLVQTIHHGAGRNHAGDRLSDESVDLAGVREPQPGTDALAPARRLTRSARRQGAV